MQQIAEWLNSLGLSEYAQCWWVERAKFARPTICEPKTDGSDRFNLSQVDKLNA